MPGWKDNWHFLAVIMLVYVVIGLIGITHHEMWPDEIQSWLIASQSASLTELFDNLEYEGHPALWYLILYLPSRIWNNPFSMQILHLVISSGAVFLILIVLTIHEIPEIVVYIQLFPAI